MSGATKVTWAFGFFGVLFLGGCGEQVSSVEVGSRPVDAGAFAPGGTTPGPTTSGCVRAPEVCDGIDNDCDGVSDNGFDLDKDGFTSCAGDCDDRNSAIAPALQESKNGIDDDCDGKIDNRVPGFDFDKDGTPFPQDCNDEEPLVGPLALEVPGDGTDNNCDGQIDEAPATTCDGTLAGSTAGDFAKAMGLCSNVKSASFAAGDPSARNIRSKFGAQIAVKEGTKMAFLATGKATDKLDDGSYSPQNGYRFYDVSPHPLWTSPKCGPKSPVYDAYDMTELKLTLQVPQNAKSFSFQFDFFSAEYPEFVCDEYNDRFIAILDSKAFQGNVSFDAVGEVVSVNNGFFDICESAANNTCTKPVSLLEKTGYEEVKQDLDFVTRPVGGATGWLTTKAPVTPGETITLRFIILDEGDAALDSAVLLDNFKWELEAVTAPVTAVSPN